MIKFPVTFAAMILFFISQSVTAQLSPPGLGETKTAFWSAVGVSQKLNEKNTSLTYFGKGTVSGHIHNDPFNMPSIYVLNQEFYHKLNSQWQYSYAASYRSQHKYIDESNAENNFTINQEFRIYGRLAYSIPVGALKWKTTLRQEVRKFYDENFGRIPDGLQLRTRLKSQLQLPLGHSGANSLTGSAEALFSVTDDDHDGWGSYNYHESRFCLYYSYSPQSLPVIFDIGYMNDLSEHEHHMIDSNYLAVDIIVKDPF